MCSLPRSKFVFIISLFCLNIISSVLIVHGSNVDSTLHEEPELEISTGKLKGKLVKTAKGNQAYAFLSIPYAENPTGSLRFADPVPRQPWQGVLNCQKYTQQCWSNVTAHPHPEKYAEVGEDCLRVNLFVPVTALPALSDNKENGAQKKRHPVLYWMHGGNFEFDFPAMFPIDIMVDNFVSQGLIMITVGYRLGALGFWSTGTGDAQGNYALKDIIQGLRWIQQDIHHFGGDPNAVTIMGHSSGAATSTLLTLSPLAVGLFHRAIMMSGAGLSKLMVEDENTSDSHKLLADTLGCNKNRAWENKRFSEVVECMRQVSPANITTTYSQKVLSDVNNVFMRPPNMGKASGTSPRIDGPGGVLPEPLEILASKRPPYPSMMGTVKDEDGFIRVFYKNATADDARQACQRQAFIRGAFWNQQTVNLIAQACEKVYVDAGISYYASHPEKYENEHKFWEDQVDDIEGDAGEYSTLFYDADTLRAAGAPVYIYSFDYVKEGSKWGHYHAFDLNWVMGPHTFKFDNEKDWWIEENYPRLYAQFALYGDPTYYAVNGTKWEPLRRPHGFNYFSVDYAHLENKPFYHLRGVVFWNKLLAAVQNQSELSNELMLTLQDPEFFVDGSGILKSSQKSSNPTSATVSVVMIGISALVLCVSLAVGLVWKSRKSKKSSMVADENFPLKDSEKSYYNSFRTP